MQSSFWAPLDGIWLRPYHFFHSDRTWFKEFLVCNCCQLQEQGYYRINYIATFVLFLNSSSHLCCINWGIKDRGNFYNQQDGSQTVETYFKISSSHPYQITNQPIPLAWGGGISAPLARSLIPPWESCVQYSSQQFICFNY